jgi:hypothetical protein
MSMPAAAMRAVPALLALLAGACQMPAETSPAENETRLMQACGETNRLLGQMKAAEASFQYDDAGNARIRKRLWTSIPDAMQDALINAIAYRAICASGEPGEQVVTIRSETSELLVQQTVTEFDRGSADTGQ